MVLKKHAGGADDATAPPFDLRPVAIASALAWLRGEIHDTQLAPGGDVVFWNELLNLAGYRESLRQIGALRAAGCKAMIVHACNPIVWHKLEKENCVATMEERIFWQGADHTARRYLAPPVAFAAWLAKLPLSSPSPEIKVPQIES